MENLQEVKALFDLINIFNVAIPDGAEESLEVNGTKIALNKKDGVINISVTSDETEEFDDSEIKDMITYYKERIKELDDYLFVEATEEMAQYFNIAKFDELLNQDTFTEEEAAKVTKLINRSVAIISKHLENKIDKLINIYNKF